MGRSNRSVTTEPPVNTKCVFRAFNRRATKIYSGTFKDADGHKGPLQCELIPKGDGAWTAKLSAKNTGSGPQKSAEYTGEFTGKTDGANTNLTGTVVLQRQGPYMITAMMTDTALNATFKKKDGGGDGNFDLTFVKSNTPTLPVEPKKDAVIIPSSNPPKT